MVGDPARDLRRGLLRPLPVPLRRPAGQAEPAGQDLLPLDPERHPRHRDAAAGVLLGGGLKGRISLNQFAALTATNHAKLYGLYPRKGSIAPGFDADLTLWDPNKRETIRQANLHHGSDYTPWEGFAVTGWPVMTIAGGQVIAEDGRVLSEPGRGRVLDRAVDPAERRDA